MVMPLNNVLIALMNNSEDFRIAQVFGWYRIPIKNAPPIVKDNSVKIIAFYHTKKFEKEKFTIQWFAEISKITIVTREQLFPTELKNSKTGNTYYKIEFSGLHKLPIPIYSVRPRRLLFISTTMEKFFSVKEVNFLYNSSQLEDKFWNALLRKNLFAERQYYVSVNRKNFFLDFALFCKTRNIDVEIDGDHYHMQENDVRSDKKRNNLLESEGWSILRFTTKDIESSINDSVGLVIETANKYGGLQDIRNVNNYTYLDDGSNQMTIFK